MMNRLAIISNDYYLYNKNEKKKRKTKQTEKNNQMYTLLQHQRQQMKRVAM